MSQENVEIVRKGWQAFERGDIEGFLSLNDPAVVWDHSHYVSGEFEPVYYGRDGIARFRPKTRKPPICRDSVVPEEGLEPPTRGL